MKKGKNLTLAAILVQLILISSSINAVYITSDHIQLEKPNETTTIKLFQQFSTPEIKDNNEFLNIHVKEANSFITNNGEPVLPIFIKTLEFPLGTRIKEIRCTSSESIKIQLSKKIIPAPKPIIKNDEKEMSNLEKNEKIYSSNKLFPESWYSYKLGGGLNRNNEHTTFLTIQMNPVKYNPIEDTLQFVNSIKLEIYYEEPGEPFLVVDEYDLLIISVDLYKPLLSPLVDHKESHNLQTKLVTVKEIYNSAYFSARGEDNPEKIKYFIKDAIENWGIKYVMLVGDFRKVPLRYTHLETDKGGVYEELKFASDLYYADIYDSKGNFSSWDSDDDGIYGEWPHPHTMEDTVDLIPDVYIGRLACMFSFEVKTLVEKIIDYEENTHGSNLFDTMIVIGGDTFNKAWEGGTDYNEGEEASDKALEYMTGFNPVRIYASLGNLTTENIYNEIGKGAGFLYFVGHGNPKTWATYDNGDYVNSIGRFPNKEIKKLTNSEMYPIVMVGGCHNSEYDVTPLNFIKGLLEEGLGFFSYSEDGFGSYYLYKWVLECWGWVFVKVNGGGAIASMGSVGYGGVSIGDHNGNDIPDCIEGLDGWFETQFFRLYNEENITILGETYGQVVTNYVNNFPVYTDRYDCKIVETHVLLGDPSLKIGGYE
ncbi:MAG: hypothetical protein JSW60_00460 [Thermoplasmatales archaeon]|nr:MAG: hypothetical protein JSW60_00460 [Thermoplasmatales archaeon]